MPRKKVDAIKNKELVYTEPHVSVEKSPSGIVNGETVSVSVSHTRNLGNFQSLSISVSIEKLTNNRDECFAESLEWCDSKLSEAFKKLDPPPADIDLEGSTFIASKNQLDI